MKVKVDRKLIIELEGDEVDNFAHFLLNESDNDKYPGTWDLHRTLEKLGIQG